MEEVKGNDYHLPTIYFRPFLTETLGDKVLKIEVKLANYLMSLDLAGSGVTHLSNPLDHARDPHALMLHKYLNGEKKLLFLGMNPGPWGMCQTGIPFGEVQSCVHFLKIKASVKTPKYFHPKRPIHGFDCQRREVSGERFWKLFQEVCETPETFFMNSFVYNHCPIAFMKESGKNVTPPELPKNLRNCIVNACDIALIKIIELLKTQMVIGVGKFSEKIVKSLVKQGRLDVKVGFLMHPSPINPIANKGWAEIALKTLNDLDILNQLKPLRQPNTDGVMTTE